jgi:tripartite-type tricarboxylate transporter receptor subunit TctC
MKLPRRKFLHLAAGATALTAVPHTARAQTYPTRPVHIVVGFPAGYTPDIIARLIGQRLSERLGQPFIIDNRSGAGNNIATDAVVRATPDGYTLLVCVPPNAINATLYDNLNFNFIRDIAPVAGTVRLINVLEVNPSVPTKTVPEFIAYAKANPGKINMASGGIGSIGHVAGALFDMMAGTDLVHVPYRGNFFPDLLGGQVQVLFTPIPSSLGYIRSGQLRALAVTSATRQTVLPDVSAMAEFLPGYEADAWNGIGAPRNTPVEIIDTLNREINAVLAEPDVKARLADLGSVPTPMTPAEFGRFIADETEKWAKVIKFANIKPE